MLCNVRPGGYGQCGEKSQSPVCKVTTWSLCETWGQIFSTLYLYIGLEQPKKTEYTVLFFQNKKQCLWFLLTCWYFPIQLDRSYTCMIENSCLTTFPRWLPSELTCLVRDFVISQFNMQIYCLTSNPEDDFPEKVKQCGSVALSNISLFEHPNQPNTATLFVPLVVQKLHTSPLKIIHNIQ